MLRNITKHRQSVSLIKDKIRQLSTVVAAQENESSSTEVIYPEIQDLSPAGRRKSKYEELCKTINKIPTVEEKLIKLNMPRYYGWRPIMIAENVLHYGVLNSAQYITKTYLMTERKLPSCYDHIIDPGTLDELLSDIKIHIEDAIVLELKQRRRDALHITDKTDPVTMDKIVTNAIVQQVNRIIMSALSEKYSHLIDTEVDYKPRIEAFWRIGGVPPSSQIINARKNLNSKCKWQNVIIDACVDLDMQYEGEPLLQLRNSNPLREIISFEESENPDFKIPEYNYNPRVLGYTTQRRHVTNIPGFWPGDKNEYGILSYHHRSHLINRNFDDNDEALNAQAIFASFGWLMSQASYQGFSPFNDITYPLVNQMVITNGQQWNFYVYQLNTTELSDVPLKYIQKRNICWATEPAKLYESVENNKLVGFNDEVLTNLLKFYVNVPEQRDYNMKPYLGETEKVIADYEDDDKRRWLEGTFKHLVSLRPRHRALPEILQWQKIFMIDNNTRPLEKKREPWEFGINPYKRRLDEHAPKYIPKVLRPNPKRKYKWEKFEKMYYP